MKRFKKAAAFFLTLIITVMFAVPAFAQEGAYSITIEPTTANHTYNVYQIFSGDIYDQSGILRTPGKTPLTPAQIVRMDWLAENVEGSLPSPEEMNGEAAQMMKMQGIFLGKDKVL